MSNLALWYHFATYDIEQTKVIGMKAKSYDLISMIW